mgnify:FL=1|tara:strand:+ start:765 stop:968 length:204 start_codon:yes stop_codon:yes gene_type:complete
MEKDKKGFSWDGKSRVVTNLYRERFDEIFGKKEEEELKESYKQSLRNKKERENKEEEEYLKELKNKL